MEESEPWAVGVMKNRVDGKVKWGKLFGSDGRGQSSLVWLSFAHALGAYYTESSFQTCQRSPLAKTQTFQDGEARSSTILKGG